MRMMPGSPAETLPALTIHNPARGWTEQESAWLRTHEQTVTAEGTLAVSPEALIALPAPPRAFDQGWRAQLTWEFQHGGYDARKGTVAPITVEVDHHGLARLLDGAHRSYAAAAAGLPTVPALVRYLGGAELLATAWQPGTHARWSGRRAALPTDVGGLLAWYDATTLNLADGAAVTTWVDRLGHTATVFSGTDTYRANGLGRNRPGVAMTSVSNPHFDPSPVWVYPSPHTVSVLVACVPGITGNTRLVGFGDYELLVNYFTGPNRWAIIDAGGAHAVVSPQTLPQTTPVVLTVSQRALNDYDLGVNGNINQQSVALNNNSFTSQAYFGSPGTSANNIIAELLVYTKALDPTDRADLEVYLMQKWLAP